MPRAVVDTNVLVSAFLFYERSGVPALLLRKAAERRFTLVTCRALLKELGDVLVRNAAAQERYGYTPETVALYRATLEAHAELVEPQTPFPPISRDPDDDVVVATAVTAAAEYLVTGDNDLLSLDHYEGVRIVTPRDFLDLL